MAPCRPRTPFAAIRRIPRMRQYRAQSGDAQHSHMVDAPTIARIGSDACSWMCDHCAFGFESQLR
jgi:hypothetical protein